MQGWLFHNQANFWGTEQVKAMVTSVPQNKLIILDLFSETYPIYPKMNAYYGQPFIWCMLQNFGGVIGMFGAFNKINEVNQFEIFNLKLKTQILTKTEW